MEKLKLFFIVWVGWGGLSRLGVGEDWVDWGNHTSGNHPYHCRDGSNPLPTRITQK